MSCATMTDTRGHQGPGRRFLICLWFDVIIPVMSQMAQRELVFRFYFLINSCCPVVYTRWCHRRILSVQQRWCCGCNWVGLKHLLRVYYSPRCEVSSLVVFQLWTVCPTSKLLVKLTHVVVAFTGGSWWATDLSSWIKFECCCFFFSFLFPCVS